MASDPIHVHDDSELADALANAAVAPVLLEHNGTLYRITAVDEPEPSDDQNPEVFRQALNNVVGIISWEEGDEMIEKIHEYRRLGSRPASRP